MHILRADARVDVHTRLQGGESEWLCPRVRVGGRLRGAREHTRVCGDAHGDTHTLRGPPDPSGVDDVAVCAYYGPFAPQWCHSLTFRYPPPEGTDSRTLGYTSPRVRGQVFSRTCRQVPLRVFLGVTPG